MQKYISKSQFKAKVFELFHQVESGGESIIVTDHGVPTIEVCRYRSNKRSPLEILKGSVTSYIAPTEPVAKNSY